MFKKGLEKFVRVSLFTPHDTTDRMRKYSRLLARAVRKLPSRWLR